MNRKIDIYLFYLANLIFIFGRATDGALGALLILIVLIVYGWLYINNISLAFLLCIVVGSNPVRMFDGFPFGLTYHFIYISDIFFYLGLACYFAPQLKKIGINNRLKRLLPLLYFFTLYQIVVSIIFLLKIDSPFIFFKNAEYFKVFLFGIYILFPAYKVIQVRPKLFFKCLVSISILYSIFYFISIYSDFKIFDFYSTTRLRGGRGAIRIFINNSEIFKITIYMAVMAFFIAELRKSMSLIIAGAMSLILILIGMYRLQLTYTVLTMGTMVVFSYFFLKARLSKSLSVIVYLLMLAMLVMAFLPSVGEGMYQTFYQTFQEFAGNAPKGATQTRTIIELPKHLKLIHDNTWIGVGFVSNWWENYMNSNDWGLSDIPITSTLAMYGVLGMLLYYSRFYFIIKDSFYAIKVIKNNFQNLYEENQYFVYVLFALTGYFISMISYRLFYIGWELTLSQLQFQFGCFIGILYGGLHLLSNKSLKGVFE